jgi:D-lactate dehydrogenase (cytochrome)
MAIPPIHARTAPQARLPPIQHDSDLVGGFLDDAAHVPGGYAAGVTFPRDEAEVAAVVRDAERVLPVGAQSSLTGGATPRGELVLSTRALTGIEIIGDDRVRVGAGVPLADVQRALSSRGLYYPPVPTYEGAFVGGTVATNAAGAATFKYGSTRSWVDALTVVLADGLVLDLRRGAAIAGDGLLEIERPDAVVLELPLPSYAMPNTAKHSAGYFAASPMDPIDLFIGSEGTLGIVVQAVLRIIPRPEITLALFPCTSDIQAIDVTGALRGGEGGDVAGVEYIDSAALAHVDDETFRKAGVARPPAGSVLLLVQVEHDVDRLAALLERHRLADAAAVAMPGDTRGAARLLELREAVPAAVNQHVAAAKARIDPAIEKTAGDMIVPFNRLADSLALYREAFTRRGLEHAIWGHFSDGNLHPNVIPRSLDDVVKGKEALLEIGRGIAAMGGSPLAEHGVGRSAVKQALLRQLYGDAGIEQMRAVKRALDPAWKLAPGVLFPLT